MTYATGRTYFDADSHLMELPGWLEQHADPGIRDRIRPLALGGAGALADKAIADAEARRGDAAAAAKIEEQLMAAKGWNGLGAFDPAERDVPFMVHVGGGGAPIRRVFHDNGKTVTDFLGGGENIRSKDFMGLHHSPEVFLSALVLDGVFDRFPTLRGGGASSSVPCGSSRG